MYQRPENRHKIKGLLISGDRLRRGRHHRAYRVPVPVRRAGAVSDSCGADRSGLHRDGGATIGNTDGNVIDFRVFGILHGLSTKWYLVPVAAIWFAVHYGIFRFAITRFNLKTPGRDIDTATSVEQAVAGTVGKSGYNTPAILAAPSGAMYRSPQAIISALPACVCRWRICSCWIPTPAPTGPSAWYS